MAITPVLNTLNNVRIIAVDWNKDAQVRMMKVLLVIFLGIAAIWFLNVVGWKELNLIPFFLGSMLLVVMGLSPITLGLVALTGTLFSRDQGQSIVDASTAEIKAWVTKVLPALLFGAHVLIGFLATWSFQDAPASFWMFAAAAMTIMSTLVVYDINGRWLPWIVITYSVAIMALALWATVADDARELSPFSKRVATPAMESVKLPLTQPLSSSVVVPSCPAGWSEAVNVPTGYTVAWSWSVKSEQAYNGGDWADGTPNGNDLGESVRFCAKEMKHVGKAMPLTWTTM